MERPDIHNYSQSLRSAYKAIEKAGILQENRDAIREFAGILESMGLNKGRTAKCIYHLITLGERVSKPFKDLTKQDVQDLMAWLNSADYTPITKSDMKKAFKRFMKWVKTGSLEREVAFPPEVSWIHAELKLNEQRKIEILTDDEIRKMIERAPALRDKALIAVLAEGGFRIGEILPAKIGDVVFDETGARITVTGKTGPRVVKLITSAPCSLNG